MTRNLLTPCWGEEKEKEVDVAEFLSPGNEWLYCSFAIILARVHWHKRNRDACEDSPSFCYQCFVINKPPFLKFRNCVVRKFRAVTDINQIHLPLYDVPDTVVVGVPFLVPPTVYFKIYWVQWYCKFYSWTLSISFYRRYSGDRRTVTTYWHHTLKEVLSGWEHHICVGLLTIRWPFWWANLSQILSTK